MASIASAVLLCALTVPAGDPAVAPGHADKVDAYLRTQMQRRNIPGLQLAVIQHGKIVKLGAYGLANVQDSLPVTNQTVFPINSITKAFVGVAAMQLVEAGKLDLAAPVSRYLDGLPAAWQGVTIRQLFVHTSGIPDIWNENAKLVADGEEAAWAKVQTLPMEFSPGERFKYNQTNYVLLGRIIDKLSGQPFTRFIQERQFDVAGMPLSGFHDSYDVVPHSARVYSYFRTVGGKRTFTDEPGNVFEEFPPSLRTAAGINTTAEELAKWIIALQQGHLFKAANSLTTLWTPGLLNNGSPAGFGGFFNGYAIGWPTVTRPEHRAIAPTGGGRAAFFLYPDDDLAVVILTNLMGAAPQSFIDAVAGYYIPSMHPSTGFGLPPAIKSLRSELMKRGYEHVLDLVNEAKKKDAKFQLPEDEVNEWGYRLLDQGQTKEAVEILKLNVSLHPEGANTYDSLAEAYEEKGDRMLAIKNYKRSLELNPKNRNAAQHLKKLEPAGTTNGVK